MQMAIRADDAWCFAGPGQVSFFNTFVDVTWLGSDAERGLEA